MQVHDGPPSGTDLDLRHYLGVVGRRRWVILVVALLVGLAAMGFALTKEERYRATGRMLLLAPGSVEANAQGFSDDPERAIANEIEILGSLEMKDAVAEQLGDDAAGVDASTSGDNDVVVLTAESTVPEVAADSVNTYARTYERVRRQRTVEALRVEVQNLQRQRRDQQDALDDINQPLTDLNAQIEALPAGPERDQLVQQREIVEQNIAGARDATSGQIAQIDTAIQDAQRAMRNPTGGVNILNPATVPSEPFFPQPKKDLAVGLIVGLLLGLAIAFVWEQLDDAVRGRADADRATGGLPIVGLVPRVPGWRDRADTRLVTRFEPRSSAAEAYRSMATSLEFLQETGSAHVLLLTSPGASEGKTTTVVNVGLAFAEAGHHTVIVDADLRRPRVHQFLEVSDAVGLSTVLSGKIDIATAVQTVQGDHPVDVVVAGPVPSNPAELLRSEITETAITKLRESYDVVLIDTPPVLPVADALVLSRQADIVILVAGADSTGSRKLSRAVEALHQVDAPLQGLVLNGVGAGEGSEYGYYGDGDDDESRRSRRGRRSRRRARS
jgi:capsular exopolysaccharide synthesis family protein